MCLKMIWGMLQLKLNLMMNKIDVLLLVIAPSAKLKKRQTLTNYVYGEDCASNMYTAFCIHENLCMVLIPLHKNNLNLPSPTKSIML